MLGDQLALLFQLVVPAAVTAQVPVAASAWTPNTIKMAIATNKRHNGELEGVIIIFLA